jgi:hypothetical protein
MFKKKALKGLPGLEALKNRSYFLPFFYSRKTGGSLPSKEELLPGGGV